MIASLSLLTDLIVLAIKMSNGDLSGSCGSIKPLE